MPSAPSELQVQRMVDNNVTLSWKPRSTGHSKLSRCIIQVTHTHTRKVLAVKPGLKCPPSDRIAPPPPQVSRRSTQKLDLPHQEVLVPPHIQVLSGLRSYSNYSVRVACVNEVGASPFSPWLQFQTPESGELVGLTEACVGT